MTGALASSARSTLLGRDQLGAGIDQLVEIDRAKLGCIRQAIGGRRARMQHFERRLETLSEAEGPSGAGAARSVLIDGKQNLDEPHLGPPSSMLVLVLVLVSTLEAQDVGDDVQHIVLFDDDVGCEVSIYTLSAVPVMPGVSATSLKRGALGLGDFSAEMAWHTEQTRCA
jgi:hypothetical protein